MPFDAVAGGVLASTGGSLDIEFYQKLNSIGHKAFVDRLKSVAPNGQDILDVGARYGSLTYKLKEAWKNANVIGLDASPNSLVVARLVCPDAEFFEHDINNPFPVAEGSQDIVASLETLKYLKTAPAVIAHMMRVLKQGGVAGFSIRTHEGERVEERGSFSSDGHKTPSATIPIYSHPFASIEQAIRSSGGVVLNKPSVSGDVVCNMIFVQKAEPGSLSF
jgi:ubiquinone/menaquinone biosynthesis C-methylase UbiE